MLWDVAIGVVSNIVYGGMARVVGFSGISVQRKQAIERSLSNPKDEKTKKFQRALDDLQKVLAHRFGTNNNALNNFLAELNRSAFPEVITETILNGVDKQAARQLFNSILQNYQEKSQIEPSPEKLFNAIDTAVRAQYDLLSGENELLSATAAGTSIICTKVEYLTKVIEDIKTFNSKRTLTKTEIDEIRTRACRQLEAKYRYITVETTRGARKYSISKLFIEPKFIQLNYDELSLPKQSKKSAQSISSDESLLKVAYSTMRNSIKRTVVLGDPGGGKSTTVQHICFEFARSVVLGIEHPDRKGIDPTRRGFLYG